MQDVKKEAPFARSAYNYDMDYASDATGLECKEPTMAQQQFAEECDINTIVERFGLTGQLPDNLRMPITNEFVETTDYQQSLDKLREADNAFMQMPAKIRAEFENDAGKFVEFVSDPKNVDKCREWGLAKPVEAPREPMSVRVIAEPEIKGPGAV